MTLWHNFFGVSLGILCLFFILSGIQRRAYNRHRILTPHVISIIGVAFAAVVWFLPVFGHPSLGASSFNAFVSSVLCSIKLFGADGFKEVPDGILNNAPSFYTVYGNILAVCAPFFTFALIMSFFKVVRAYTSYYRVWYNAHIFSELNDKTLALAKSIRAKEGRRKSIIVFSDIIDKNEESHLDLVDGAKELGAILFRKDLEAIQWAIMPRHMVRRLNFYLVSNDESEKIRHAKSIVRRYNNKKCSLLLFSDSEESKNLLLRYNDNKDSQPIRINIMRIDSERLLTYGYLADNGEKLFRNAVVSNGGLKVINATVVGFGNYGKEMMRALLWYCQMPGYKVDIRVIDRDERAQTVFEAMLPGFSVGENHENANDVRYHIEFITASFGERGFLDAVKSLPEKNFFFVSLGDDKTNMLATSAIRCAREQAGKTDGPMTGDDGELVTTVIYSSDIKDLVRPEVKVIGDLDSFYSFRTFESNRLIEDGILEHCLWTKERQPQDSVKRKESLRTNSLALDERGRNEYQLSSYNFYSSIAKALHRRLREQIVDLYDEPYRGVLQGTKTQQDAKEYLGRIERDLKIPSKRKDAERRLRIASEIEHVRWNAYLRTEGFVYSEKRSTRFLMHDKLVSVDKLSAEEYLKDI